MPTTPKLCRHRGSQQGYVTLNGREHYLGNWSRDQKKPPARVRDEYDTLISRWLANGRKLPHENEPASVPTTVNAVILAFVKYAGDHYQKRGGGKPAAETSGIKDACKVLSDLFGRIPAAEFGPKALKQVRAKMVELDWSRSYCNKQVNRLKRMFRWAVAEEMVPPSVIHGLAAVPAIRKGEPGVRETGPVKPVPTEWVEAMLPHASPQVAALVRFQIHTGARPGEAVLLRGQDIDQAGRVWVFSPERHKTEHRGHRREIYIGPKAQAVLRPWLTADPAAYLFSPAAAELGRRREQRAARQTKVPPSQSSRKKAGPKKAAGDRYTVDSYRRAIEYACKKADRAAREERVRQGALAADVTAIESQVFVPKWSPHRLRHNAATALRKEFGVEMAQLALGHAAMDATLIYAERDREKVMGAFERVG